MDAKENYDYLLIVPHGNFPVPKTGLYYCTFMECYHHNSNKVQQDCCYAVANDLSIEQIDEIIKTQPAKPKNLAARFSQQPTEKSREDLYQIIQKYLPGIKANELTDTLIQSGYLQIKNPIIAENGLSANTDSVDAEQAFKEYYKTEIPDDIKKYLKVSDKTFLRQGFMAGLSSKVKPVNEKMREALQNVTKELYSLMEFCVDRKYLDLEDEESEGILAYKEAIKKAESALSTAPDDVWIPVEKHPEKEMTKVLVVSTSNCLFVAYYVRVAGKTKWMMDEDDAEGNARYFNDDVITHWQPLPNPPKV